MTFNIASKAANSHADIKIIDPDMGEQLIGEGGKLCSVTVHGPGTKPFLAAQASHNTKLAKRYRAKGNVDSTPEQELSDKAAFLTAITVSFNNFSYNDMPDGEDAFRACYMDAGLGWLTKQVNEGAGDWSNFTAGSSTS